MGRRNDPTMAYLNEAGSKYDKTLTTKEIAKRLRGELKAALPGYKLSITSDHNSISVEIRAVPPGVAIVNVEHELHELRHPHGLAHNREPRYTAAVESALATIHAALTAYNYDRSDRMTDYCDVNFYEHVTIASDLHALHARAVKATIGEGVERQVCDVALHALLEGKPEAALKCVLTAGNAIEIRDWRGQVEATVAEIAPVIVTVLQADITAARAGIEASARAAAIEAAGWELELATVPYAATTAEIGAQPAPVATVRASDLVGSAHEIAAFVRVTAAAECGNCGRALASDGSCRGGCATPSDPDPVPVACQECGGEVVADDSPGVFVHADGQDVDADRVATPDLEPEPEPTGTDPGSSPAGEPEAGMGKVLAFRPLATMGASMFAGDLPRDLAQRAHAGTSFSPETRGSQEIAGYCSQLASDHAELAKYATTPEKVEILREQFAKYRTGYAIRYRAMLTAKAGCMSTMITGGSNFPVARQRKRSASADKRTSEVVDYRDNALARIKKALRPELRPIMAGDDDATTRLRKKIATAKATQEFMKAANAAIRKYKGNAEATCAALGELAAVAGHKTWTPERALKLLEKDFAGRIGFPDYQVKNNGAEIRRLEARLAEVETAKATPASEVCGALARLEDSPADNRVRLYFPGKPDKVTRDRLKGEGFRWTPTLGCWQAYRNHRALVIAAREAGEPEVKELDAAR